MKKLTKKAIAAAAKYIVAIDYKASYRPMTIEYKVIKANDIFEAMQIADMLFDENTVYLLNIMEKTGEVHENEYLVYEDKLTSRTEGNWHLTDAAHSEQPFKVLYNVEYDFVA